MKLLTQAQHDRLLANGRQQDPLRGTRDEIDFKPVVKLFNLWGGGTWLLTELDPDDPDIAFGLCDLGVGTPELGSVRISELRDHAGPFGLNFARDLHWSPRGTLMDYARAAWDAGYVTEPRTGKGAR